MPACLTCCFEKRSPGGSLVARKAPARVSVYTCAMLWGRHVCPRGVSRTGRRAGSERARSRPTRHPANRASQEELSATTSGAKASPTSSDLLPVLKPPNLPQPPPFRGRTFLSPCGAWRHAPRRFSRPCGVCKCSGGGGCGRGVVVARMLSAPDPSPLPSSSSCCQSLACASFSLLPSREAAGQREPLRRNRQRNRRRRRRRHYYQQRQGRPVRGRQKRAWGEEERRTQAGGGGGGGFSCGQGFWHTRRHHGKWGAAALGPTRTRPEPRLLLSLWWWWWWWVLPFPRPAGPSRSAEVPPPPQG